MRRFLLSGLIAFALTFSTVVAADGHASKPTIGIGYHVVMKAGHGPAMADGIKEFLAFRKENNDPMTWMVYQSMAGDDVGDFYFYSGNANWADLDAYQDWEAGADASAMWSALAAEHAWDVKNWIDTEMSDMNRPPEDDGYSMFWVTTYHLKVGMGDKWDTVVKKYHDAVVATDYDAHYFMSRGEIPTPGTRTIVSPYKGWGDMEEPDQSVRDMLVGHYGEEVASQMFMDFMSTFDSSESFVVRRRDDLMPAAE